MILLMCVVCSLSHADDGAKKETASTAANASIDLSVPESPAFKVLGVTPNKVDRPSSPKEFAASLVNGIDTNGNFQSGFALDTSPYLLFNSTNIGLKDYQTDYATRFLSRSQLSFATANGATDTDKSLKLAVGIKFTPWDEGDPRNDKMLTSCLEGAISNVELSMDDEQEALLIEKNKLDFQIKYEEKQDIKDLLERQMKTILLKLGKINEERQEEFSKKINETIKSCRENKMFVSNLWNKSSWAIGFAPTFITSTGNTQDLMYSGLGAWTSVAYGIYDYAQFITQATYRNKEQIPDQNAVGTFFEQDNMSIGARIRFGRSDINGNIEGLYAINDTKNDKKDDNVFRYSAGIEFKVANNFWLTMNIGSESGNSNGNKLFALGDIKWAYETAPSLSPNK